jgi:hypothetical protein
MVSHIPDSDLRPDPRVRALLAAAAAPTEPGPLPGETAAVAAFRDHSRPRRTRMPSSLIPVRVAVAAGLGTGLLLAGGVGAAAAGVLPGAAQDTARTWLDTIGVAVPGPDEHSAGHADERGRSADSRPADETGTTTPAVTNDPAEAPADAAPDATAPDAAAKPDKDLPAASEHGRTVSETARETELEGADKGALVSETAKSRSRAGDRTAPEEPAEESSADDGAGRPAHTQDAGAAGKATADEASGGRRDDGGDRNP